MHLKRVIDLPVWLTLAVWVILWKIRTTLRPFRNDLVELNAIKLTAQQICPASCEMKMAITSLHLRFCELLDAIE
jgi:hypothetical protein